MLLVSCRIRAPAKKRGHRPRGVSFARACVRACGDTHTATSSHFSRAHTISRVCVTRMLLSALTRWTHAKKSALGSTHTDVQLRQVRSFKDINGHKKTYLQINLRSYYTYYVFKSVYGVSCRLVHETNFLTSNQYDIRPV